MTTYVVIVIEYDYDSATLDRLVGCATFSELKTAQEYARRKAEDCCKDLGIDESEMDFSIYGDSRVYDEDINCDAIQCKIIKSNVDEFARYANKID